MPSIAIPVSLRGQLLNSVRAVTAFSPSTLFALNEPGVWYDPSDLTTLFQDTAGTLPVTTPGQTVALALDKSKGLVLGSELVTNGDFSVDADWTKPTNGTISGGTANFAPGGGATANFTQTKTGLSNTWVRYSITVSNRTAGQVQFRVLGSGGISGGTTVLANGTYTGLLQVLGNLASFQLLGTDTSNLSVDNVTVKELPGFHATQATLASRPTYGIVPLGGRRNLLTRTEEFENAYWSANLASVTANATTAPNGTTTADLLTADGSSGSHFIRTATGLWTAGGTFTETVYIKRNTANFAHLLFEGVNAYLQFSLTDGSTTFTSAGTATNFATSVTDVGSGWYRARITATNTGASTFRVRYFTLNASANTAAPSETTTASMFIWGAQLETGSSATAYQRVGSAFDVTEAGVASLSYLSFDGVDDFLITPTISPGIDKAQVFAGVRHLSALTGIIAETSTSIDSNNGVVRLTAQAAFNYSAGSKGTTAQSVTSPTIGTINTSVLTAIGDISAPSLNLRTNGVAATPVVLTQGTGNYLAYPLYIGRRAGTTAPLNGNLFSLIVRFGTNLDAGTITSTETWVNSKTGAYI